MTASNPLEITPIDFSFGKFSDFDRINLLPGVWLQKLDKLLAAAINDYTTRLPIRPDIVGSHMLVLNKAQYLRGLDRRLAAEGKHRELDWIETGALLRQVCVAITLKFRLPWAYGNSYGLRRSRGKVLISGGQFRPIVRRTDYLLHSVSADWYRPIEDKPLAKLMVLLDPYYRSGVWRWDRFSVALGYLWSALTTTHGELAFAALSMALEAVCAPGKSEITHQLAERCAILGREDRGERLEMYKDVKTLYGIRSTVVHGRPKEMKKGSTSKEWAQHLFVSATRTAMPGVELGRMLSLTTDVLLGAIENKAFRAILQKGQSEEAANAEFNAYFQGVLLG